MYNLGYRLKEARIRRNLTQKVLADRVNKSVSAISSYESNAQLPPLDVLISIAKVLHVSLDYLAGLDTVENYSAKGLQPEQKEIADRLFAEFTTPTAAGTELSEKQIIIIQKLFKLFSEKNES